MPKPTKGPRLGGSAAHQRHILSNLATALFEHGRITTTEAKARTLRPYAEKLITKAKKAELGTVQSLHLRREVLKTIHDKSVVHELFTVIGPGFAERPGGYTRITKIGPRKGDNAPMAVIELVTEDYKPAAPRATRRSEGSGTPVSTETPAASTTDEAAQVEAAEEPSQDVEPELSGSDSGSDSGSADAAPGTDDPATQAAEEDAAPVEEAEPVADEPSNEETSDKA